MMQSSVVSRQSSVAGAAIACVVGAAAAFVLSLHLQATEIPTPPRPVAGMALRCTVDEVYDGDTVTVTVQLPARVRLLNCWAPEIRTKDADEKQRGLQARDHLKEIAEGKKGLLYIPTDAAGRLDHALTMGRVLGFVWIDDDDPRDLSTRMRDGGWATMTKETP